MFALLGASMPRVGGDYVWVSRVLSPPLALISNLCMIMGGAPRSGLLREVLFSACARPVLVALGAIFNNSHFIDWGNSFQTNNSWILGASLFMVLLQTLILISGTKATFRWQNYSFIIAMAGTLVAFIVLLIGSQGDFFSHFDTLNKSFGGGNVAAVIARSAGCRRPPRRTSSAAPRCRRCSRSRDS